MKARNIVPGVDLLGAVDWDRRLFDSLIPLPDGTSYNVYLVKGSEKTALIDAVDPAMVDVLLRQLADVAAVDYLVALHAEQDHSGTIATVLERYPNAKLVCTPKAKGMLIDHVHLPAEAFVTVADGETLSLGDRTLQFIHMPWIHWPETMVAYLQEEKILFSTDLFGSHLATSETYADEMRTYEPAKRYYAEIMMPLHHIIQKHQIKLEAMDLRLIAPSHGPVYKRPEFILEAYHEWLLAEPRNLVVLPYVSMHGSTKVMVDRLVDALVERGVEVQQFALESVDLGKLAVSLVDAATVVIGTPTVLGGPHPLAAYAAFLANQLKPKVRFLGVIGSYGWGGKSAEQLGEMLSGLKAEVLPAVLSRGLPREADLVAVDRLADEIAARHEQLRTAPGSQAARV